MDVETCEESAKNDGYKYQQRSKQSRGFPVEEYPLENFETQRPSDLGSCSRKAPQTQPNNPDYISTQMWLILLISLCIPFLNLGLLIVMPFVGENETRKNFFRAVWVIFLAAVFLYAILSKWYFPY